MRLGIDDDRGDNGVVLTQRAILDAHAVACRAGLLNDLPCSRKLLQIFIGNCRRCQLFAQETVLTISFDDLAQSLYHSFLGGIACGQTGGAAQHTDQLDRKTHLLAVKDIEKRQYHCFFLCIEAAQIFQKLCRCHIDALFFEDPIDGYAQVLAAFVQNLLLRYCLCILELNGTAAAVARLQTLHELSMSAGSGKLSGHALAVCRQSGSCNGYIDGKAITDAGIKPDLIQLNVLLFEQGTDPVDRFDRMRILEFFINIKHSISTLFIK